LVSQDGDHEPWLAGDIGRTPDFSAGKRQKLTGERPVDLAATVIELDGHRPRSRSKSRSTPPGPRVGSRRSHPHTAKESRSHSGHTALWVFLRPMLSPRLVGLPRDAFVIDDTDRARSTSLRTAATRAWTNSTSRQTSLPDENAATHAYNGRRTTSRPFFTTRASSDLQSHGSSTQSPHVSSAARTPTIAASRASSDRFLEGGT